MAQLSGVMTADFSDFHFEIDKSVTKLKELEGATGHTTGTFNQLDQGLSAADKTLGALGIHIGPQIQAMRELGNVAGLTFDKLGLWGSLGLAASIGTATYQLTTMITEWTGLDKVIGDATASLLGWGDVAAQRAGAGMDVLNRATQIAGRTIKDFDQAMQIIKEHNLAVAESFNTGADRVRRWGAEIDQVRASGNLPTITRELKEGTSTAKQLADQFHISAEAITWYSKRAQENSAILDKWRANEQAGLEKVRKAQEDLNQATGGWHATLLTISPTVAKAATEALNLGVAQNTVATAMHLSEAQVSALDRQMKLNLATMAATEPALGTLDQWIKTNVGDTREWNNEWRFTSEVIDTQVIPSLDAVTAKAQEVSKAVATAIAITPGMDQKSPGNAPVPINTGNISYQGGFESVFAEYQRRNPSGGMLGGAIGGGPPKDFLTWALSLGLATRTPTVTNTFNIVDTESGIARRVGDTITSQIQKAALVN